MSLSQPSPNRQWVVLARYTKGHYRQPVCPDWHIYGDVVFTDYARAKLLCGALRNQGVSARVEDRAVVEAKHFDSESFVRPKACLKVATGDPHEYIKRQSPADIALYALYKSMPPNVIDTLGEGNWSMFVPMAVQQAVHPEITVKRSLYKATHHERMVLYNGRPLFASTGCTVAGGTTYKVSCHRYGVPTLGVMRLRVPIPKRDQRVVFGQLATEKFVWRVGVTSGPNGVPVGEDHLPFQMDIGTVHSTKADEWCGLLTDCKTAAQAVDDAKQAIIRYVLLQLFAIKGI